MIMATPSRKEMMSAFDLHQQGDLDGAERVYRRILAEFPGDAETCHLLGLLAHQQGRNDDAVVLVMEAVAGEPLQPAYRKTLGDIFRAQGEFDRAAESYRRVLRLDPGSVEALEGMGKASSASGDLDAALEWYRKAVEMNPCRTEIYLLLGKAFMGKQQLDAAQACYQAGLKLDPNNAEAHGLLGEAFSAQNRYDEAIDCFRQALALKPESPAVLSNLGNALKAQGCIEEAFQCHREALRLAPGHPDLHRNFASALAAMHRFEEAIAEFDAATDLCPDLAEAHTHKAILLLLTGSFERGWKEYQWRFKVNDSSQPVDSRKFAQPLWDGSDLHGKRILVRAEQGVGDMVQFCRFLAPLKKRGGTVLFECPPRLSRLLGAIEGADTVVPHSAIPPVQFDVHVPLLSLPGLLGSPMEFQPLPIPYLQAPREYADEAKNLVGKEGLKVGIAWQGNPQYTGDTDRSTTLREFLPLMQLPGVRFFSLQKGFGSEQLSSVPAGVNIPDLGNTLDCGPDAFVETAAVLEQLDLVITTDTALPHLAGALGRPVWLVVSRIPEWRWLLEREDSPWYPTMRIFRQETPGDWGGVFAKVARALTGALAGESPLPNHGRIG